MKLPTFNRIIINTLLVLLLASVVQATDIEGPIASHVNLLSPNEYYPLSAVGDEGWNVTGKLEADLNGDGLMETIWIIWKPQGHGGEGPWQVYIEDPGGERTHVFARYLNHQQVHVFTGATPNTIDGDWSELFILNMGTATIALYQVVYCGPGEFKTIELTQVYPLHWAVETN